MQYKPQSFQQQNRCLIAAILILEQLFGFLPPLEAKTQTVVGVSDRRWRPETPQIFIMRIAVSKQMESTQLHSIPPSSGSRSLSERNAAHYHQGFGTQQQD